MIFSLRVIIKQEQYKSFNHKTHGVGKKLLRKKIKNFGERKRNSFALLEKFLEDIEGDETRI